MFLKNVKNKHRLDGYIYKDYVGVTTCDLFNSFEADINKEEHKYFKKNPLFLTVL